jgi:hypothetical protein
MVMVSDKKGKRRLFCRFIIFSKAIVVTPLRGGKGGWMARKLDVKISNYSPT